MPIGDESRPHTQPIEGIVVGTLVGLTENGATPLVTFPDSRELSPLLPGRPWTCTRLTSAAMSSWCSKPEILTGRSSPGAFVKQTVTPCQICPDASRWKPMASDWLSQLSTVSCFVAGRRASASAPRARSWFAVPMWSAIPLD